MFVNATSTMEDGLSAILESLPTAKQFDSSVRLVATTEDEHKYAPGANPDATIKAILTLDGFVETTDWVLWCSATQNRPNPARSACCASQMVSLRASDEV